MHGGISDKREEWLKRSKKRWRKRQNFVMSKEQGLLGVIVREGCIQDIRGLRKEQSCRKVMDSLLRAIKVRQRSLEDILASGNIITV